MKREEIYKAVRQAASKAWKQSQEEDYYEDKSVSYAYEERYKKLSFAAKLLSPDKRERAYAEKELED